MQIRHYALSQLIQKIPRLPLVITLVMTAAYCLSLALLLDQLLPENNLNVTRIFVGEAWKIFLYAAAVVLLILFFISKFTAGGKLAPRPPFAGLRPADSLLVLLPLTPIIQYVVNNQDILSLSGSLAIVVLFLAFTATLVLFIPLLFTRLGAARPLMIAGVAFVFTITNMASMTAHYGWFESGDLKLQLGLQMAVFVLTMAVYGFLGQKFTYSVVTLYFLANSVSGFLAIDHSEAKPPTFDTSSRLVQLVGARTPKTTPNIYLLVYDAYVANETMLSYGIDNSAQEDYLTGLGFKIYPHTYSVAAFTTGTMSRVFSVSAQYSNQPRSAAAGNSAVHHLLQGFGYETYGLFWSDYFFQSGGSHYDHSYPTLKASHWMLTKAILMGEFRFDVEFDSPDRQEFVDHKYDVFKQQDSAPKFVYMHDNRPGHSQNSGECLPDETELFVERLTVANAEMKDNLAALLRDDPSAIIIVAGDHGPYLTKNCKSTGEDYEAAAITRQDIQDRYGAFLAIRWPNDNAAKYDDIVVIQDVFPVVFATIFDNARYLDVKIKPKTMRIQITSGVYIRRGMIQGGVHSGEPLYLSPK